MEMPNSKKTTEIEKTNKQYKARNSLGTNENDSSNFHPLEEFFSVIGELLFFRNMNTEKLDPFPRVKRIAQRARKVRETNGWMDI